jgi:hypothetical protein
VLDCLRLWGCKDESGVGGWCNADRDGGFQGLTPIQSFDAWHGQRRVENWDELASHFVKEGAAPSSWRMDIAIPDRWKSETTEADRTRLIKSVLQAIINKKASPTVVIAVEPAVAAIIFYAALRLIPDMLRTGMGFSTYEPNPARGSFRLVATTFASGSGDLQPQLYQSDSFVCNSFKAFKTGMYEPVAGTYADWAIRMLAEGKYARIDSLHSAIEKAWGRERETFAASDLEQIRSLEVYWTSLFRKDFRPPPANLPATHGLFLAIRCSSAARAQRAALSQMSAADSAKLIRLLMDVITPFRAEWKSLESTPEIAHWIKAAVPGDEPGVLAYLSKAPAHFSDADVIALLLGFVAEHRRLPSPTPQSRRLWGELAVEQLPAGYLPPALLVKLIGQLGAGSLTRILPTSHSSLDAVKGVAEAIGRRLASLTEEGQYQTENKRLVAHLRLLLDTAAMELNEADFERLLSSTQIISGFYNPEEGAFGDRISRFVRELPTRAAKVCVNADIIRMASAWAGCAVDYPALQSQLRSWKNLFSWFAVFDRSRDGKIPFGGFWSRAGEAGIKDMSELLRILVPDGEIGKAAADTIRRNLLTTILATYRQQGWLPVPGKSVLGFGATKDLPQESIDALFKTPAR